LIRLAGRLGLLALLVRVHVDCGTILCADVVPLSHPLRRIVPLPKHFQHIVHTDLLGVERYQDHFGVGRGSAADLLVRGIRRVAARVAHGRREHARELPELLFGAPEAAHPELDDLLSGKRRPKRSTEHGMPIRDSHLLGPAGQCVFRGGEDE
jgi:hypothetical protein